MPLTLDMGGGGKVMREFAEGRLHSGKGGPVVKSRDQAVAIMLSMKRRAEGLKDRQKKFVRKVRGGE